MDPSSSRRRWTTSTLPQEPMFIQAAAVLPGLVAVVPVLPAVSHLLE
ncbi:unnamed protein product, partial [Dibothriocephalus latus]